MKAHLTYLEIGVDKMIKAVTKSKLKPVEGRLKLIAELVQATRRKRAIAYAYTKILMIL